MSLKSYLWEKRTLITRSKKLARLGAAASNTVSWALRHNPFQRFSAALRDVRFLNVGCGYKPAPNFLNLDYTWHPGIQLVWDLKWRLPLPSHSLEGIYTEHCLEHIALEAIQNHVLPEFLRTLKPGGILRVIVPDAAIYLKAYSASRTDDSVTFPIPEWDLPTPMMHVNQCFRGFGHQFAYDFETFRFILEAVGFKDVVQVAFRKGGNDVLWLDSPERERESLYIEATKA